MFRSRHSLFRQMFWVPLCYVLAALAAGFLIPRFEREFLPSLSIGLTTGAAVAVLSAIGSGMMALTGIVFSVAFVMVQFSATAYSPRLVLWLARSASINHSIGMFTATFIYSLFAVAWVDRGGSGYVPPVTVFVAVALLLVSMGFFVWMIDRIGMLQVTRILAYAGDQGRTVVERMYPPPGGPLPVDVASAVDLSSMPVIAEVRHEGVPVIVQALETDALVSLAGRADCLIEMAVAVGDTVMDGMPLLRVRGGTAAPPTDRMLAAVALGADRTFEQDPKYAIRILVDVAIKALSPAINDPTTAVQALDQIEDLLLRLGRRNLDVGQSRDAAGRVRLVVPVPSWDDLVVLALDEIRFCGATSVQVMRRTRALLYDLHQQVLPERRAALDYYMARVDTGIRRDFQDADDQHDALTLDRQGLGMSRAQRDAPGQP